MGYIYVWWWATQFFSLTLFLSCFTEVYPHKILSEVSHSTKTFINLNSYGDRSDTTMVTQQVPEGIQSEFIKFMTSLSGHVMFVCVFVLAAVLLVMNLFFICFWFFKSENISTKHSSWMLFLSISVNNISNTILWTILIAVTDLQLIHRIYYMLQRHKKYIYNRDIFICFCRLFFP